MPSAFAFALLQPIVLPMGRQWQRNNSASASASFMRRAMRFAAMLIALLLPVHAARAADVTVGLRLAPPYVMEAADGFLTGLEYELVRETLHRAGHRLVPRLLTFSRLIEDFRRGALPAFAPAHANMNLQGCISDVLLVYQNIGLTLRQRDLLVENMQQLGGLRIMAFQNARALLPGLGDAVQGNPDYVEVANQMLQVRALFSRRADIVLADRRLLYALIAAPDSGLPAGTPLREHLLFAPTPYSVAFASAELCQDFNRALAGLRASGDYDRLLQRYDPHPLANGQQRGEYLPLLLPTLRQLRG